MMETMRKFALWCCSLCLTGVLYAQGNDPVVMKINGKDVPRSEFEYNFNKNNGENVVDKKTVDEYVDLFVNYKLKVEAALDARYDTLSSFKKEFRTYRDQQIRPYFVSVSAEEKELKRYYDGMNASIGPDGLIHPAHIMILVAQRATPEEQPKEFEDVAFSLNKGEMSKPFQSPMGYHIVLMKDRKQLESYEELKPQLQRFLESRGLKERVASMAIDSLVKGSAGKLTEEDVIEQKVRELCAKDESLKYLIQEYHDGLLLYEISTREVWDKAAKDTVGLEAYFKAHKSKYKWDEPRYRGVVYHCKDKGLVKDVRKLLKSVDEAQWIDTLRASFNQDSVKQSRVEKNLFKKGDNAFVDHLVFKEKKEPKPSEYYPYTAVYGKKLRKPKDWTDVRGEVVSDYQAACEAEFVRRLRETYKVEIYKEVLNTVNKH